MRRVDVRFLGQQFLRHAFRRTVLSLYRNSSLLLLFARDKKRGVFGNSGQWPGESSQGSCFLYYIKTFCALFLSVCTVALLHPPP